MFVSNGLWFTVVHWSSLLIDHLCLLLLLTGAGLLTSVTWCLFQSCGHQADLSLTTFLLLLLLFGLFFNVWWYKWVWVLCWSVTVDFVFSLRLTYPCDFALCTASRLCCVAVALICCCSNKTSLTSYRLFWKGCSYQKNHCPFSQTTSISVYSHKPKSRTLSPRTTREAEAQTHTNISNIKILITLINHSINTWSSYHWELILNSIR